MSSDSSFVRLDPKADATLPALTVFAFGEGASGSSPASATVPLAPLAPVTPECWIGAAAPESGNREGIRYTRDGTWLMGELRADIDADGNVEATAHAAYQRLLAFNAASGYPQLLRVWNFLDRLNEGAGDAERYRRFCVGRYRAIAVPGFEQRLPAATVIGSRVPGLIVSFLAGKVPGVQVENPRQTSAFLYPRDYGPISPSFSRATLVGQQLLVSGTAAVVGHATLHPGDATAQFGQIETNVAALLGHTSRTHFAAGQAGTWQPQALRVYVRRESDVDALLPRIRAAFGPGTATAVLHGDISRSDLMVEIEGVWSFQPPA